MLTAPYTVQILVPRAVQLKPRSLHKRLWAWRHDVELVLGEGRFSFLIPTNDLPLRVTIFEAAADAYAAPLCDALTWTPWWTERWDDIAERCPTSIVVEMKAQRLTRVLPDGRKEVIAQLGGGPNGAAIGPDGAMYVANNGGAWGWAEGPAHLPGAPPPSYSGGSIQRVDLKTGAFTTLYDTCDGRPLNSPNDLVFDDQGGFWFTCYGQSDGEVRRLGALYYAKADGSKITR